MTRLLNFFRDRDKIDLSWYVNTNEDVANFRLELRSGVKIRKKKTFFIIDDEAKYAIVSASVSVFAYSNTSPTE